MFQVLSFVFGGNKVGASGFEVGTLSKKVGASRSESERRGFEEKEWGIERQA